MGITETGKTGLTSDARYLQFSLGVEHFAVPLLSVREVMAPTEITQVPFTPAYYLGIMNVRGQVISVVDLRLKFGFKAEKKEETALVICDFEELTFAVVVDSVNCVLGLGSDDISPAPTIQSTVSSDYITGVTRHEGRLTLLLDLLKVLNLNDRALVKKDTQRPVAAAA